MTDHFVTVGDDLALPPAVKVLDGNLPAASNAAALALKAPLASPTFTGTVGGITKAMVGLGSVDNTADTAKPVSTAQQTALDLKQNKASLDADAASLLTTPGSALSTAGNATYGLANPTLTVTYNSDGSVASTVENGVTTTFTYNTDGTVHTQTRAGVTKTFTYDANGNVTGAA